MGKRRSPVVSGAPSLQEPLPFDDMPAPPPVPEFTPEQFAQMEAVLRGETSPASGHYVPEQVEGKPWMSS